MLKAAVKKPEEGMTGRRIRRLRRSAALAASVALLATGHETTGHPAMQRSPGFSTPSVHSLGLGSAEAVRPGSWRRRYEALMAGLQASRRLSFAPRRAYATLDEETLFGLDAEDLAEKLALEDWSAESVLVKSLSQAGASRLSVWRGPGGMNHMSFGMDMGIPWHRVRVVEGWSRNVEDFDEKPEEDLVIRSTVRSLAADRTLSVEMAFHMNQPILKRLLPLIQLHVQPAHVPGVGKAIKVWIGGRVEWKEGCHFLIRKPMEHGFLLGLRTYSSAILDQLRQHADPQPTDAQSWRDEALEGGPLVAAFSN